jgi:hypothetical protein
MRLSDKDILQIDATVTTGLLIFLTISFVGEAILEQIIFGPGIPGFPFYDPESAEAIDIPIRLMLTMAMLAPFVISAVIVLANDLLTEYFERKD